MGSPIAPNITQPASLLGQKISHYQVRSLLGVGAMGEVYLAEDTQLDRKVALKLMPAEGTRDEGRVRRFVQEARSAAPIGGAAFTVVGFYRRQVK